MAEDDPPFDVDVTTADPGAAAITRSGTGDTQFGTRALITDAPEIGSSCNCGGLAYVGVFDEPGSHAHDQPALVFAENRASNAKYIAEATSHEVGHNFDLSHDGTPAQGYYTGHAARAPIMGVGYYKPIAQWSKGEYEGANNLQRTTWPRSPPTAGLRWLMRPPDLGSGRAAPGPTASADVAEIVTSDADSDVFEVSAGAGPSTFTVTPAPNSPNLDAGLRASSWTRPSMSLDQAIPLRRS